MHYLFLYGSVSEEILLIKTFGLIMWKVTKKVKWQSFVLNVKKKKMTKKVAIKEGKLLAVGMQYDAKKWISYIKKVNFGGWFLDDSAFSFDKFSYLKRWSFRNIFNV